VKNIGSIENRAHKLASSIATTFDDNDEGEDEKAPDLKKEE
jgi:hypothetical protein